MRAGSSIYSYAVILALYLGGVVVEGPAIHACRAPRLPYPDVVVSCGPPSLVPGRPDTVTNPVLLVEVLSDATREYDRGEKLAAYQTIPTCREVLLVEQDRVAVEHLERDESGRWTSASHHVLDASIRLSSVGLQLPLAEVYREVFGRQP